MKKTNKYSTNMNFKIGELDDDIYINSSFMVMEKVAKKEELTIEVKDLKKDNNGKSKSKLF